MKMNNVKPNLEKFKYTMQTIVIIIYVVIITIVVLYITHNI